MNSASPTTETIPGSHARSRHFLAVLAICSLAALFLRLGVGWELSGIRSVVDPWTGTDMATYRAYALDICRGHFPEYYYYQPFYYAVFLPLIYLAFGSGAWGVIAVQAVLGAVTVWLTGLTAAKLFGKTAGIAAALILCLSRYHIFYTPFCLIAVLQSFWMSLLLFTALWCWERPRILRWLFLALCCGMAVLTRGNVLLLLPCYFALIFWRLRKRPGRACLIALVFVVISYLPQLPFALKNRAHYGRWTGPSSAQDAVLALGNTPEAPPGGLEYPLTYKQWTHDASLPPGQRIPVTKQILAWAAREPVMFADLKFRTFLLFWNRLEVPNNIAMANEGTASRLLQFPFLLDFAVIGTLGFFGMCVSIRRRSAKNLLVHATIWVYCAASVIFYVLTRFRVPVLPILCVFGGSGIACIVRNWRQRRKAPDFRHRVLFGCLLFAVSVFFVNAAFQRYQQSVEISLFRRLRPNGMLINVDEKAVVYDHGPLAVGGLSFIPIPPQGLVVRKQFSMHPHQLCPGTPGKAVLRIPLSLQKGAKFSCRVAGQDTDNQTGFENENGLTWFTVPVKDVTDASQPIAFEIGIQPENGDVFLGVDNLRDYGRTMITTVGGTPFDLRFEAALELEWRKEKALSVSPTDPSEANGPAAGK